MSTFPPNDTLLHPRKYNQCWGAVVVVWIVVLLQWCSFDVVQGEEADPAVLCDLYIAPSTIPNAGLGVFTTRSHSPGDVLVGDLIAAGADVCIPLLDLEWHNGVAGMGDDDKTYDLLDNPFRDYVWAGLALGMGHEVDVMVESIAAYWPGINSLINSHTQLINLHRAMPQYQLSIEQYPDDDDDETTNATRIGYQQQSHRQTNPTAGSYTPYSHGSTIVRRTLHPGSELFVHYGRDWFTSRVAFDGMALSDEYETFFLRTLPTFQRHVRDEYWQGILYEFIVNDIRPLWKGDSRMLAAWPADWNEMKELLGLWNQSKKQRRHRDNTAAPDNRNTTYPVPSSTVGTSRRDVEFLQQHGSCADAIRPGTPSAMEYVTRGAFATRAMAKGQIVTTSPVLVLRDKTLLDLNQMVPSNNPNENGFVVDKKLGDQLVLNYCLGDDSIPLLLCPNGPGVNLINHGPSHKEPDDDSSGTTTRKGKANIRLEWASDGVLGHNASVLTLSPSAWNVQNTNRTNSGISKNDTAPNHAKVTLAIRYVAITDIAEGDELLMDYGPEWKEKWKQHLDEWDYDNGRTGGGAKKSSSSSFDKYVSATQWNRAHDRTDLLWTMDESQTAIYPPSLVLRCHSDVVIHTRSWKYDKTIKKLAWEGDETTNKEYGYPCHVVHRIYHEETDTYLYDADITVEEPGMEANDIQTVVRYNLPRRAFKWFDKPHTTDLHLARAFRHHIGLPKDMIPAAWQYNDPSQPAEFVLSNNEL